ncbi:Aste57867_21502 [Aphanomyces stellatus]|uniref:Aste57867_21502 protein n=1 Tax=Aphanomyces stellatus TaxID=120398 RepID=A0A485LIZ2_9STRA|nr:hypothetical protein As57867_021433 [Aphanomyces stellatus]VFT98172.1 Aste57867_21502 [Aphanomyces stellatus]
MAPKPSTSNDSRDWAVNAKRANMNDNNDADWSSLPCKTVLLSMELMHFVSAYQDVFYADMIPFLHLAYPCTTHGDSCCSIHMEWGTTRVIVVMDAIYVDNLPLLCYVHKANLFKFVSCPTKLMDLAAHAKHFDVLQFLHAVGHQGCTTRAMDAAAKQGNLAMAQFLTQHRTEGFTTLGLYHAICSGTRRWSRRIRFGARYTPIDLAAENGRLPVVEALRVCSLACSYGGLYMASTNGHVDVVEWLIAHQRDLVDAHLEVASCEAGPTSPTCDPLNYFSNWFSTVPKPQLFRSSSGCCNAASCCVPPMCHQNLRVVHPHPPPPRVHPENRPTRLPRMPRRAVDIDVCLREAVYMPATRFPWALFVDRVVVLNLDECVMVIIIIEVLEVAYNTRMDYALVLRITTRLLPLRSMGFVHLNPLYHDDGFTSTYFPAFTYLDKPTGVDTHTVGLTIAEENDVYQGCEQ